MALLIYSIDYVLYILNLCMVFRLEMVQGTVDSDTIIIYKV